LKEVSQRSDVVNVQDAGNEPDFAMAEISALMHLQVVFTTSGFLPPRTSQSLASPSA
jgi:hypothetical protein